MAATSSPSGIIESVAAATLPASSCKPEAAEASTVTARVSTPMMTVAVVSAAKRPKRTCKRGCGVESTSSSRPSSSSADQRLAWVTAKAINSSGRKTKSALRMVALVATSLPPTFVITFFKTGELW